MDCGSVSGGKKDSHSFTIKSSGTKLHFKVRKYDFNFSSDFKENSHKISSFDNIFTSLRTILYENIKNQSWFNLPNPLLPDGNKKVTHA